MMSHTNFEKLDPTSWRSFLDPRMLHIRIGTCRICTKASLVPEGIEILFVVVLVLVGWVYGFVVFYVHEHPKAQPAVVLILKRLRRRGRGLMSHLTVWEKPTRIKFWSKHSVKYWRSRLLYLGIWYVRIITEVIPRELFKLTLATLE